MSQVLKLKNGNYFYQGANTMNPRPQPLYEHTACWYRRPVI